MALFSRVLATRCHLGTRHSGSVAVRRGFRRFERGLEWYKSLSQLYERTTVSQESALVAMPYEYEVDPREAPFLREFRGHVSQVMKYAMFHSHEELLEEIENHRTKGHAQLFNEVLEESRPRCLYFDLDGDAAYNQKHAEICKLLHFCVRHFFGAVQLGWNIEDPVPVVLTSCRPDKYSSHVVFPQIQFANHAHQSRYVPSLLRLLQEACLELESVGPQYVLKNVLDTVPYKKLQLLRGPWACKLQGGSIDTVTRMEPEEPFWGDELTYFASYVQPDYALDLPSMEQISGWYPCVAQHAQDSAGKSSAFSRREDANLFSLEFCRDAGPKSLDLAGLTMLERFEKCMRLLHPERACDWWSWFRISGVTKTVLDRYDHDDAARQRIWDAHCEWSSNYPNFSEEENFQVIIQAQDRRTPGLKILYEVLEHDYPGLQVREHAWPFRLSRKSPQVARI